MANPNIVGVTSIYGEVAGLAVGTSASAIVALDPGAGSVLKINALYVSNVDGASAADVTVDVYDSTTTETFHIAKTISVPADSTLDVISKSIYITEGKSLRLTASASGDIEAVCSYERIS